MDIIYRGRFAICFIHGVIFSIELAKKNRTNNLATSSYTNKETRDKEYISNHVKTHWRNRLKLILQEHRN